MSIVVNKPIALIEDHLEFILETLQEVDIPVTGVYMATKDTDPGVEIDDKYILQYSYYCHDVKCQYHLDRVESPGEEIFESNSLNDVIKFIMEN